MRDLVIKSMSNCFYILKLDEIILILYTFYMQMIVKLM